MVGGGRAGGGGADRCGFMAVSTPEVQVVTVVGNILRRADPLGTTEGTARN